MSASLIPQLLQVTSYKLQVSNEATNRPYLLCTNGFQLAVLDVFICYCLHVHLEKSYQDTESYSGGC